MVSKFLTNQKTKELSMKKNIAAVVFTILVSPLLYGMENSNGENGKIKEERRTIFSYFKVIMKLEDERMFTGNPLADSHYRGILVQTEQDYVERNVVEEEPFGVWLRDYESAYKDNQHKGAGLPEAHHVGCCRFEFR